MNKQNKSADKTAYENQHVADTEDVLEYLTATRTEYRDIEARKNTVKVGTVLHNGEVDIIYKVVKL